VADFFCAKEREEIKSSSVQILFITGFLGGDENTRKELQVVPSSTKGVRQFVQLVKQWLVG